MSYRTPPSPSRHRFPSRLVAALLCVLLAGAALAEHDPSGDRTYGANENATEASVLPVETIHDITYDTLPRVHELIEENTGAEVEYSLVHICVGSDCMAVDPFRFNR